MSRLSTATAGIERSTVATGLTYPALVAAFERELGQFDPAVGARLVEARAYASLYVPFRVCLYDDGGPDGACIAFDRPSSFLATLERPEVAELGTLLDQKIDAVVAAVAR